MTVNRCTTSAAFVMRYFLALGLTDILRLLLVIRFSLKSKATKVAANHTATKACNMGVGAPFHVGCGAGALPVEVTHSQIKFV